MGVGVGEVCVVGGRGWKNLGVSHYLRQLREGGGVGWGRGWGGRRAKSVRHDFFCIHVISSLFQHEFLNWFCLKCLVVYDVKFLATKVNEVLIAVDVCVAMHASYDGFDGFNLSSCSKIHVVLLL